MNFFEDEGLDFPIVYLLRVRGHKVIYAAEEYVSATDGVILDKAFETDSILITKDKDFGELIIRRKSHSHGAVLIRVENLNEVENCLKVVDLIEQYSPLLRNSFTVIQENNIRTRPLEIKT